MTREEAIQILRDWDGYFIGHGSDDVNEALNMSIKALEQTMWIPVSSGVLPKPYEQVLRTVKSVGWNGIPNIYVDISPVCPGGKEVLAWMPTPKPYRIESEDEDDKRRT